MRDRGLLGEDPIGYQDPLVGRSPRGYQDLLTEKNGSFVSLPLLIVNHMLLYVVCDLALM